MKVTVDRAGRLVVPKAIRERVGLHEGREVEVSERNGVIEIVPVAPDVDLKVTLREEVFGVIELEETTDVFVTAIRGEPDSD